MIGAETFSRLLDWEDRTTCVLFGDGAGAMVLEAVPDDQEGDRGVLSSSLRSDGNHWENSMLTAARHQQVPLALFVCRAVKCFVTQLA